MVNTVVNGELLDLNEADLLDVMRKTCRLCMIDVKSQCQINLLTKACNGKSLLEVANKLADIHITQYDRLKSLFVCLNCAGKLANVSEFRDECRNTDKKLDQMEKKLRLKHRRSDPLSDSLIVDVDDDDVEVQFNCKLCCKIFATLELYKEHKQQHSVNESSSTASTSIVDNQINESTVTVKGDRSNKGHISRSNSLHNTPYKDGRMVSFSPPSERTTRKKHTFPSMRPKSGSTKNYLCLQCNINFNNHQAQRWHDVKIHHRPFSQNSMNCKFCQQAFQKLYQRHNHERRCSQRFDNKPLQDSQVIAREVKVEPNLDDVPIFELVEVQHTDNEVEEKDVDQTN